MTRDGADIDRIRQAAARQDIHVVPGFSERSGGSLYMGVQYRSGSKSARDRRAALTGLAAACSGPDGPGRVDRAAGFSVPMAAEVFRRLPAVRGGNVGVRRPYLQALFATAGYDPLAAADNRPPTTGRSRADPAQRTEATGACAGGPLAGAAMARPRRLVRT
jgi:hypothetical protein